jgi:putative endonuclease
MAEPKPARRAAHDRGLAAEARAAALLEGAGFTILARRVRTPAGEIDLIARQDGLIVFCEVKARGDRDTAAYSLLPRQRRRIAAAAEAWLAARPDLALLDARFDAVLVSGTGAAEHIPGAFEMDA